MNLKSPLSPGRALFVVGCILLAASSLHAAVIFQEDFATVNTGWNIGTTANGTISFAPGGTPAAAFSTRSLLLSHTANLTSTLGSSSPLFSQAILRSETDEINFSFSIRMNLSNESVSISLLGNNSQKPINLYVRSNGNLTAGYWDGGANAELTLLSGYAVNTTYTFNVKFTPSSGVYSASVTGGTASLENAAYQRLSGADDFTTLTRMSIINNGATSTVSDLYLDNILIQSVPEPGTVSMITLSIVGLAGAAWRWKRQ